MNYDSLEFNVVVKIKKDNLHVLGPGIKQLLELTETSGSLRAASKQINMSYSKAHGIIKNSEITMGYPLLKRRIGGVGGGSSCLTEKGGQFLNQYKLFEKELADTLLLLSQKYFSENTKASVD